MRFDNVVEPAASRGGIDAAALRAWTSSLFHAIDTKDTEAFMRFIAHDARFQFANFPAAVGVAAVREAVAGFFASVASLEHTVRNAWTVPGHVVCRGTVSYTRHDARVVKLDFCNVLALDGDSVADYRVYIDPAPLFAA